MGMLAVVVGNKSCKDRLELPDDDVRSEASSEGHVMGDGAVADAGILVPAFLHARVLGKS